MSEEPYDIDDGRYQLRPGENPDAASNRDLVYEG